MGKYFVMSLKFNKSSASDFGFKPYGEKYAINPNDNSLWMKKNYMIWGGALKMGIVGSHFRIITPYFH